MQSTATQQSSFCVPVMFLKGGLTRKHCFVAKCLLKVGKPGNIVPQPCGGSRALIGGGGVCIFIYSGSAQLISFQINLISKEISWPEPEYMNMHPPPPVNTLDPPLP